MPPLARFVPSATPRPDRVPDVEYPTGSTLRIVARGGDISYQGRRIMVGAGIATQKVRIEERDGLLLIFYASKKVRELDLRKLHNDKIF